MGRRTSLYLSDELDAAVRAAGLPLAELVRRGLAGIAPPSLTRPEAPGEIRAKVNRAREAAELGKAIRAERATARRDTDCPHPMGRRLKGLCMACGTRP